MFQAEAQHKQRLRDRELRGFSEHMGEGIVPGVRVWGGLSEMWSERKAGISSCRDW